MKKKPILARPIFGLIVALLLPVPASASIILNLSLASPVQFDAPGGPLLSFIGTISTPITNTGTVFLNGDSANVDFPLTLDDSAFFNNAPVSMNPGQTYTGDLFDITVPTIAVPGTTYNGFFAITGNAGDTLASVTFTVTATPEPGTVILLLSGFLALARSRHRKF
jgi:hypothetical protein